MAPRIIPITERMWIPCCQIHIYYVLFPCWYIVLQVHEWNTSFSDYYAFGKEWLQRVRVTYHSRDSFKTTLHLPNSLNAIVRKRLSVLKAFSCFWDDSVNAGHDRISFNTKVSLWRRERPSFFTMSRTFFTIFLCNFASVG